MPAISLILLVLIAALAAPQANAQGTERADYQAAFDDAAETSDFAPPSAWPAQGDVDRRPQAARAPARLPVRFSTHEQAHADRAVRPASATEPAAPAPLAGGGRAIPLAPPQSTSGAPLAQHFPTASIPTVVGSLASVVGLFLVVAWVLRRTSPKGSGLLPGEVIEVLGRAQLTPRQQLHLLRLGNKLILVSMSPGDPKTLAEITDPAEVDRLSGLCYQAQPNGSSASFRQIFKSFEDPRAARSGALGADRIDLSHLDTLALGTKEGKYARK